MGQRLENWQKILVEEVQKPRTFQWGVSDCVCYGVDVLSKYTNKDFGIKHIGKWNNALGAYKYIIKYFKEHKIPYKSKDTLNNYIMTFWDYHFPRVHINLAQRGDIVGFYSKEVEKENKLKNSSLTVGIMCEGFGRFVATKGYQDIPREQLQMAWRV